MGYIPFNEYEIVYKDIRKICSPPQKGSVLVFVAPDIDSICATKILLVSVKWIILSKTFNMINNTRHCLNLTAFLMKWFQFLDIRIWRTRMRALATMIM